MTLLGNTHTHNRKPSVSKLFQEPAVSRLVTEAVIITTEPEEPDETNPDREKPAAKKTSVFLLHPILYAGGKMSSAHGLIIGSLPLLVFQQPAI